MPSSSNLSILAGPTSRLENKKTHELVQKAIQNNTIADEIALIFEENEQVRKVTYRELNNLSDRLANHIRKTVGKNELFGNTDKFIVAVHMHPSEFLIITLLAIWKAGAAYLPLDPNYPAERIEYIISDSKPAMVIYDNEGGSYPNTFKLRINDYAAINELIGNRIDSESDLNEIPQNEDLAIVLYTSGSTGVPKGVCLSHTMIVNRLEWQFKTFPFSNTEKVCVFKTVITFVDCVFEIWGPLMEGRSLLILPKTTTQNPEKLVNVMQKYSVERIILVPTLLRMILTYKNISKNECLLRRLNLWICSGEVLSPALVKEFYNNFARGTNKLCNVYGSTEFIDVTYNILTSPEDLNNHDSVPLGIPSDNSIIYVLDDKLNIVKEGDHGEIYAAGLSVLKEYISVANQDRLVKNPHNNNPEFSMLSKSGDVAYVKNGVLYFVHRTDSIVKIRGKKIDMLEIDKKLNEIDGVKKTVVLCYHADQADQNILAFVQTELNLTSKQIESALAIRLPDYMVPTVVLIKDFPLLINGKVDRQTLLKNHEENLNNRSVEFNYEGVPQERKEDARLLFETVSSISNGLFDNLISLKANFFEIGGNSLNAIFTISKLRDFGLNIGIHEFVNAANLGEVLTKLTGQTVCEKETSRYTRKFIEESDKSILFDIFKTSFYKKSNIECYVIDDVTEEGKDEFLEILWPFILKKGVTFLIKEASTGEVVGISINYEIDLDFEYTLTSKLEILNVFFDELELPLKKKLVKEYGNVMYGCWATTVEWLPAHENVAVMHYVEQEILKIAEERNCKVIMSTNHSPITVQLAEDVYGYTRVIEYQLNQYVAPDNTRPFAKAPDSQLVYVHYRVV